jgi:RNA polymerase sigma-70 factor, ECF subfamily
MISKRMPSGNRLAESAGLQTTLVERLLAGDQGAWRLVAETVRQQLRDTAAAALPAEMGGRADASDIVQQSLIEANGAIRRFHGRSMQELVAWLTAILNHNVNDAVRRHLLAERRSVRKETHLDDSSSGGPGWNGVCAADQTSPSMAAAREEVWDRLHAALTALPPRQRDAVRLRHLDGRTLAEIERWLAPNSGVRGVRIAAATNRRQPDV